MSDYIINNFLPGDRETAKRELECYNYCLLNALEHFAHNKMYKASIYHQNAARSLDELQRMANAKKMEDKLQTMLTSIYSNNVERGGYYD